jgi:predicted RNase H-like nuclease
MNETTIRLLYTISGVISGYVIAAIKHKIENIENAIMQLDNSIPTPEEMAQEVLKVKLPLNKVPPDTLDAIKKTMQKMKKGESADIESPSYVG